MKNYIIGALAVIILVLVSIIYKNEVSPKNTFPVSKTELEKDVKAPIFLYVFFSRNDCLDCQRFIRILNDLPPDFVKIGIVPEDELKDEKELRALTGATFPLRSSRKYKKYGPYFSPAVVGVSPAGHVVFSIPGVPGAEEHLKVFLDTLYEKRFREVSSKEIKEEKRYKDIE